MLQSLHGARRMSVRNPEDAGRSPVKRKAKTLAPRQEPRFPVGQRPAEERRDAAFAAYRWSEDKTAYMQRNVGTKNELVNSQVLNFLYFSNRCLTIYSVHETFGSISRLGHIRPNSRDRIGSDPAEQPHPRRR